ncbi:transcription elongation factor GreAB [Stutzerimonas nosocomialis]|uniref:GreA/GreB family elongation factor n=1 Tax=Stutzerimonas nosocomialis TaxID=1056496 RepID=UPI001108D5C0|nr:GreA/GreB family elongation factor [Stutzerimonas nosocomialis]TLX55027.1 transcription elongation factor GreAB [Stutzerimonas nosocomialis]
MDTTEIQLSIIQRLQEDLRIAQDALRASHEAATHAESKAENKYDTRGLEAAYLADGQRRRVHEIETALAAYRNLKVERGDVIRIGALVALEHGDGERWVYLGPDGAGLKLVAGGREILVISPRSPLGQALLGREQDDEVEIRVNGQRQHYLIREHY